VTPDATFVFVYGPPAVGKLTVAQHLADRTGFRLLHNHLVIDAITPLFPFGTDGFFELTRRFRSALYETAAREGVDVVLTYGHTPDDQVVVEEYVNVIEQHGGRLVYVQLVARPETLRERVALPDRQDHGKIADAEALAEVLARWDFSQAVPYEPNLRIDTDTMAPAEAVDRIVDHFGLPGDRGENPPTHPD
jgi:predicted kinase